MAVKKSISTRQSAASQSPQPLPKGPHTVQLVFHLLIHSLLILLSTLILPSHLLTRSGDDSESKLDLLASIGYFFSLTSNSANDALLRKCMWGGLQGVIIVQGWALIRFKKWYDLGIAISQGDRNMAQEVNKLGWFANAERLTLSSVSLPAVYFIIHSILVLLGAPLSTSIKATAQLSLAVSLLIGFPLIHILPSDMSIWTRLLGQFKYDSKQELVLLITTYIPLVFALLSSATLSFDHGLAWSATWPISTMVGLFVGVIVADLTAIVVYLS
ncbi:unnamed protein product [Sympodiomycopsis kandeliae]